MRTTAAPASLAGGEVSAQGSSSSGLASASKGLLEQTKGPRVAAAGVLVSPLAAGMVVGAVAAGFYGASNILRYAKSEKSGKQAAVDTVKGSAGLGVSAGLGIAAGNAIAGTSLALGSAVIVPMAAGVAAAYASIRIWHKLFFGEKTPSPGE